MDASIITQTYDLLPNGVGITESGMIFPDRLLDFVEWEGIGRGLFKLEGDYTFALRVIRMAIGDWVRYGEAHFSEHQRYAQALEATGLSYGRISNLAWIAGKIEPGRRRIKDGLGIRHHAVVAPLSPEDQEELLDLAVRDGLTSTELRELSLDRDARNNGKDPAIARAERALGTARDALERVEEEGERLELVQRCLLVPLRLRARI